MTEKYYSLREVVDQGLMLGGESGTLKYRTLLNKIKSEEIIALDFFPNKEKKMFRISQSEIDKWNNQFINA